MPPKRRRARNDSSSLQAAMPVKLPTTLLSGIPRSYIQPLLHRQSLILCSQCETHLSPQHQPPRPVQSPIKCLTTTPLLRKKGGKQDSKRTVPLNAAKTEGLDPFDHSDYEAAIKRAHEHLKSELAKIKAGGRSAESIEGVKVKLVKEGKETVPLRDVASVLPRGRNVAVLVGEKDHVKAVMLALTNSSEELNPTSSPTDPLTILVPIPPTTKESREAAKAVASKKGEEAMFVLREARGAHRKRLRAMELGRQVGPDDARKAEKEMEKLNEKAVAEGKKMVEGCRKGLDGG